MDARFGRWITCGALVAGVAAACGYPDANGETPSLLPERTDRPDASYDAALPEEKDASSSEDASDAATVPPASDLCNAADLALCLPFEGSVVDGSPNKLGILASSIGFGPGKVGMGATLTTASSMAIGPSALFDGPEATIEAWVKLSPVTLAVADAVVFDADGRYSLTITAAREVLCKTSGGAASGGVVVVDQWSHVACVVGGGAVRVYLDGTERGAMPGAIVPNATLGEAVGNNAPSGENFVGALDSVRVFRVARTPADIGATAKAP